MSRHEPMVTTSEDGGLWGDPEYARPTPTTKTSEGDGMQGGETELWVFRSVPSVLSITWDLAPEARDPDHYEVRISHDHSVVFHRVGIRGKNLRIPAEDLREMSSRLPHKLVADQRALQLDVEVTGHYEGAEVGFPLMMIGRTKHTLKMNSSPQQKLA